MSTSETPPETTAPETTSLDRQAAGLEARIAAADPGTVPEETVRALVTAAARLYAAHAEATGAPLADPLRPDVSPTEVVELACGLLRARDLNPFDLALWFSRPR